MAGLGRAHKHRYGVSIAGKSGCPSNVDNRSSARPYNRLLTSRSQQSEMVSGLLVNDSGNADSADAEESAKWEQPRLGSTRISGSNK